MSSTDRQSRLLVTEDWKRIYQSFRNADFQSYDFDNLRRTMINYLRQNYPEDFNDYIESSEYLALVDLIAYLGQNLSFRVDLNARENFLETAERRESVLRLARLISYNPTRNKAANGLLKFDAIKTTESVFDSTGTNLSGVTVKWNDRSNENYFEQFIKILNSALPINNSFGRPIKSEIISNVNTEQYRVNSLNTDIPTFSFSKNVEGRNTRFELVSTALQGNSIVEEPPLTGNSPSFLYRDDGQGSGSSNTGFFMHFRQGQLDTGEFSITNPIPNQIINIDTVNINNDDVWLYSIDSNGFESELWTKLDSVEGNNIIYNSVFNNVRSVYAVTTRIEDRINLIFSDGVFGKLPSGNFRVYFRSSVNRNLNITPDAIQNVTIEIPYLSRNNTQETLTITLSLKNSVSNGSVSESNTEIKTNAPATYYTQNRLITAEDYNIGPLGISQDIIKTKSVNRVASGISRYYDLRDPSGKYSNVSIFADDGVIYKQEFLEKTNFLFNSQSDIEGIIYNIVEPILSSTPMRNFYLDKFNRRFVLDLNAVWNQATSSTNRSTGILKTGSNTYKVSSFTAGGLRFLEPNALCKFIAPALSDGTLQYFTKDGNFTTNKDEAGAVPYIWSKVVSVTGDGTLIDSNGFGGIVFNDIIPTGALLEQIVIKYSRTLTDDLKIRIINRVFSYKDFGLRFDQDTRQWEIITDQNLNTVDDFNLGKSGDSTNRNLDSSWLLYFKTDGERYTISYRNLRYVFESSDEIKFYFDSADKIYDPKTGKLVKDNIKILGINKEPASNNPLVQEYVWSISDAFKDSEGYINTRKIQVEFFDNDNDGIFDNPDMFIDIVKPDELDIADKYIFQQKYITSDGVEDYRFFDNTDQTIQVVQNQDSAELVNRNLNRVFYLVDEDVFKTFDGNTLITNTQYRAFIGRSGIKFHYTHVADSNYRIDPGSTNIIDTYLLTRNYDTEVRKYLKGGRQSLPLPPSSDELFRSYGSEINKIKSISDEVVYHPVKYKMLFGKEAKPDLQVDFKIVKNSELTINDNELKASVINAINEFFSIEYWDFGSIFYFQELSAYIMNTLSPRLVSVVIVPKQPTQTFGSLFEIKSESDEIFISAADVSDVVLIDENTATNLQANGNVITSTNTLNTGIQSAASRS